MFFDFFIIIFRILRNLIASRVKASARLSGFTIGLRGDVKEVAILSGALYKFEDPPPPFGSDQKNFFLGGIFSPDMEK